MKKTLQQGLLAALIISITACGGGSGGGKKESSSASSVTESSSSVSSSSAASSAASSSSSSAPVSTTYTVSISAPVINEVASLSNFLIPNAMAADAPDLTGENFAVVIVDLAGNVLERIELDDNDVTQNDDGTYSINVPGDPRLDCLIVTNLNGPIVLPEVANINALADLLFAPTTDENVDIDIGSTAAYVNFLEQLLEGANEGETDFADLDLDVNDPDDLALVESIINNVQEVINDQVITSYDSIEEAIAAIQAAVVEIVVQEALNITNPPAEEVTVANSIQNGGVYWYEGREPSYIEYGAIIGEEPEVLHRYNGRAFEVYTDDDEGELLLSNGEWITSNDGIAATSFNDDGSAILADPSALDHQYLVQSTLTFSLTGRNISEYFYANFNTRAIADILNPTATFGEGAVGLRLNVTTVNDTYRLWFNPGDDEGVCPWDSQKNANDFGGNCETLGIWTNNYQFDNATTSMAGVLSADVASGADGFVAVGINWPDNNQSIGVQLVNNEAKTAKYYLITWSSNSIVATPVGESTWSYIDLPGAVADEANSAQAIRIEVPEQTIGNGDFDDDEAVFIMTLQDGFMRLGNFEAAGQLVETGLTLLNDAAHDDVQAAIAPKISENNICFSNGNGWTGNQAPHIWFWEATGGVIPAASTLGEWPGQAMTQEGEYYCYDFTELLDGNGMPATMNVIFNNNNNGTETATLSFTNGNACYQGNAETGAWTTLEACGFKVVADQSQDLLGTWQLGDDYMIFGDDGSFTHIKASTDDDACQAGLASGTYWWDQLSGSLSVELNVDTTAIGPDDSCTIGGVSDIALEDGQLYIQSDGDDVWLNKVVAAEEAPLNGGWTLDGMDFFVFDGNSFAHAKVDSNNDDACQVGIATGTFSWNQESSAFAATLITDNTAVAEDDSCSLPGESVMVREGDSLQFTVGEDVFSMMKVGE